MKIQINRNSVAAGDDAYSHAVEIDISENVQIIELLKIAKLDCPLAKIHGGKATWIICIGNFDNEKYIGVEAQQCTQSKLIIDKSSTVESIFSTTDKNIYFKYWCQSDPNEVFNAIKNNMELPDKYGR